MFLIFPTEDSHSSPIQYKKLLPTLIISTKALMLMMQNLNNKFVTILLFNKYIFNNKYETTELGI